MARAKETVEAGTPLYERDFCQWVEEQVRLLKEGRLQQLDIVNLIDEIEDLAINRKHAVTSNLVVLLNHLLKDQFQARRRSRSWLVDAAPAAVADHTPQAASRHARSAVRECYVSTAAGGARSRAVRPGSRRRARAAVWRSAPVDQVARCPEFLPATQSTCPTSVPSSLARSG